MKIRIPLFALLLTAACLPGCASQAPTTVTEKQFTAIYGDEDTYTDVYYIGSQDQYDYFCMEHWTINKPDLSDAKLDKQSYFRVLLTDQKVRKSFPLTYDTNKWVLERPHAG